MKTSKTDVLYFLLPLFLWPLSFIVLKGIFIYALLLSTAVLALFSLYRRRIRWMRASIRFVLFVGIAGAISLYVIFFLGNVLTNYLGLQQFVNSVYSSIYGASNPGAATIIILAIIGAFEEIYWRGGVQGYIESSSKRLKAAPWVGSSAYYAAVHIFALNPILAVSALAVGIVAGIVAYKYGIVASIISHVIWLEMIVVFLPVYA